MASTTFLTLGDTVTVANGGLLIGGDQAQIVGSGAIWKDDSDGTYADLVTQMFGPDQPQFGSSAGTPIVAPSELSLGVGLFARIRVAAISAAMPYPTILLNDTEADQQLLGSIPGTCPTSPAWVDIPVTEETTLGVFDDFFTDPTMFEFNVLSPYKTGESGDRHWSIYEARLYATTRSSDAPPCRIFPRSDGLGVGAGRVHPPPQSQQRSSRGVGYY